MIIRHEGMADEYSAEVIADSVSADGDRITTFVVTLPRIVLAEFNTHRALSRNSASSRAIPVVKQLARVLFGAFVPDVWGMNQPGMQASGELSDIDASLAEQIWLDQRDYAVVGATALIGGVGILKDRPLRERIVELKRTFGYKLPDVPAPGVHKELASRLLEPFMWHKVVVTATNWGNFFALRDNPQAQPQIQRAAHLMQLALAGSTPTLLGPGEWHLPFIQESERNLGLSMEELAMRAIARCARVSYLTHDGELDPERDIKLFQSLLVNGHMSPFEHVARPMRSEEIAISPWSGNFYRWFQYRKGIPHEDDFSQR